MELNGGNTYKSDFKLKKNGIILRIGLSLDPFYLENRIFFLSLSYPYRIYWWGEALGYYAKPLPIPTPDD